MEGIDWRWALGLLLGAVLVFRLGFGMGKLARRQEDIRPISTAGVSPTGMAAVHDALRRGRKIEAIRLLREETGCGLAEAKKTIDGMMP